MAFPWPALSRVVLVAGTTALDLVARIPVPPHPDVAVEMSELTQQRGGCGANVALALARLGHRPTLLSAVGEDFAGSGYEQALEQAGVDLGSLVHAPGELTARAIMATTPEEVQYILFHPGATPAMAQLEPVEAALAHFAPGEISAYPRLMAACQEVCFDPGQEVFHRPHEEILACLEHVDILLLNNHEADHLAEQADGIEALTEPIDAVIVRDAEGQTIHTRDGDQRIPAAPARVADPTGAGDAHSAGFVHGRSMGWPLDRCCRFGSAVAACAIEAPGAQGGLPSLPEAEKRMAEAYPG